MPVANCVSCGQQHTDAEGIRVGVLVMKDVGHSRSSVLFPEVGARWDGPELGQGWQAIQGAEFS